MHDGIGETSEKRHQFSPASLGSGLCWHCGLLRENAIHDEQGLHGTSAEGLRGQHGTGAGSTLPPGRNEQSQAEDPAPFLCWDDLQACVPKWWQVRKRLAARRWHRYVQSIPDLPSPILSHVRHDSVLDHLAVELELRKLEGR